MKPEAHNKPDSAGGPVNHTPGPWSISVVERGLRIEGGIGRLGIANIPNHTACADANARLIAAAPELLEALKAADELLQSLGDWVNAGDMAWAYFEETGMSEERTEQMMLKISTAIAHAEGRKPRTERSMNEHDLSVRPGDTELLDALEKAVKDGAVTLDRSSGYVGLPDRTRVLSITPDRSFRKAIEDAFIQLPKPRRRKT